MIIQNRKVRKAVAALLVAVTNFSPMYTLYAQAAEGIDSVQWGTNAGKEFSAEELKKFADFGFGSDGKSATIDGDTIEFGNLFGKDKDGNDHQSNMGLGDLYGGDGSALDSAGSLGRYELSQGDSIEADAYNIFEDLSTKDKPDLRNDATFSSAEDLWALMNGDDVQCDPTPYTGDYEETIQTCERSVRDFIKRDLCEVKHEVEIDVERLSIVTDQVITKGGEMTIRYRLGEPVNQIDFEHKGRDADYANFDADFSNQATAVAKDSWNNFSGGIQCGPNQSIRLERAKVIDSSHSYFGSDYRLAEASIRPLSSYTEANWKKYERWVDSVAAQLNPSSYHNTLSDTSNYRNLTTNLVDLQPYVVGQAPQSAWTRLYETFGFNYGIVSLDDTEWSLKTTLNDHSFGLGFGTVQLWPGDLMREQLSRDLAPSEGTVIKNHKVATCEDPWGEITLESTRYGEDDVEFQLSKLLIQYVSATETRNEWVPDAECSLALADDSLDFSYSCSEYFGGGPTRCGLDENDNFFCPDDISAGEYEAEGVSRMCKTMGVQYSITPFTDKVEDTCSPLEDSGLCSFVGSQCKLGTIDEQITELYNFGLAIEPDENYHYWLGRLVETGDFNLVRSEFFEAAKGNGHKIVNEYGCTTFENTYSCKPAEAVNNYNACQAASIFDGAFEDCKEEIVTETVQEEIHIMGQYTCDQAVDMSSCNVSREIEEVDQLQQQSYAAECIIEEDVTMPFTLPEGLITDYSFNLINNGVNSTATIIDEPSFDNDWTAKVRVNGTGELVDIVNLVEVTCPEGEAAPCYEEVVVGQEMQCLEPSSVSIRGQLSFTELQVSEVVESVNGSGQSCQYVSDDYVSVDWTCTNDTQVYTGGQLASGAFIDQYIGELYPGEGNSAANVCLNATAQYTKNTVNIGEEVCTINTAGEKQCQTVTQETIDYLNTDQCAPYEAKVAAGECSFVGVTEVDGTGGDAGDFAHVVTRNYECIDHTDIVETTKVSTNFVCGGQISCMGEECIDSSAQQSNDFEQAVAAYKALEYAADDASCVTGPDGIMQCSFFSGESGSCKQVLGGWIDCCENPQEYQLDLGDYLAFLGNVKKMDAIANNGNILGDGPDSSLSKFKASVDEGIGDQQWWETTKKFANKMDIWGTIEGAGEMAIDAAVDWAIEQAKEMVLEVLGQKAAEYFGNQIVGGLTSAISFVGAVYTAYKIVEFIAIMIWECTDAEVELNTKKDQKVTHRVFTKCTDRAFGGCIEKKQYFCVYSSPMVRVFHVEGSKVLGKKLYYGDGDNRKVDCSGLSQEELAAIDWSKADLSEIVDLLKATDLYQGDASMYIEDLTSEGGLLGGQTEGDRVDATERYEGNFEGTNSGDLYQHNLDQLNSEY